MTDKSNSSLPTPDISHLSCHDYQHVYEPAEDSFLFLDALEKDIGNLRRQRPTICVEVGSGTGIVSTFLLQNLNLPAISICTDINPKAAELTDRTARQNRVQTQPVLTDLVSALLPRLHGKVDVLLFNPPYVVTPPEEVGSSGIEASWAGGLRGRQVIDRLLPLVPALLSEGGAFYMVIIKENNKEEVACEMAGRGLRTEVILSRRSGPEHLSVLKFTWNKDG